VENDIIATEPYVFHTSNKPGITISTRWHRRDTGRHFITAIDIQLSNITRITQSMRPTENGVVFVFTQDLRLVGLPAEERLSNESAVNATLLKTISAVDLPVLRAGIAEWERYGRTHQSFPFKVEGQRWWAGFEWIEDHPAHAGYWTGIIVPENDFLGELSFQRNLSLAAVIGLGLILSLILVLDTIRKMRFEVKEAVSHIGQKLGPFELLYKIGDGGNGSVYRAKHALLKRPTAIKVMLPQYARSEFAKQRFINEVQMTSGLAHPNTIAVFDFGQTPEGTLYYAMEHLNGVTLEDLVRISGPQPATRVMGILHQICGSLTEAHAQGLIHQDIKPTNIMLCEHGGLSDVVKVLDFGLVRDFQNDAPEVTGEKAIVGNPFYIAPELIADAKVFSPASDLYALGGVGYYLLTGHNVFEGGSTVEICAMHLHDQPIPPSQRTAREIPSDLEAIVMGCLAKRPEDRPPSAREVSDMLRQCHGFGDWTQERAQKWWNANRDTLPVEEHADTHAPLSNTQQLIDIDGRLGS
jgi:serine/threonine protein kinase